MRPAMKKIYRATHTHMKLVSEDSYKTYHNHRAEPYFTFVKNGQKTIEGRIKKGWYQHIAPGDHIIIYNKEETDNVEVLVKGIRTYESLREMLEKEELKKVFPDVESVDHGVKIYERFYSPDQEKKYGVVAIEVERVQHYSPTYVP